MARSTIGCFALFLLVLSSSRNPAAESSSTDELTLSEMRYKKGLELIRLLYEKILSLDHHFNGMRTGQLVESLCNPVAYEEIRAFLEKETKTGGKRNSTPIPGFGMENPHLAASFLAAERFLTPTSTSAQREEMERIACLLDFSLRINADLHLIFYETAFLIRSNNQLEMECRELFVEYVQAIGYAKSLEECRKTDDWESVFRLLEQQILSMRRRMNDKTPEGQDRLLRDHINLEFAVDRLLNFIRNYQAHIQKGSQYYYKFQLILEHRAPQTACMDRLPLAWNQLKSEIALSIESFDLAYQVPEFKGSRMKDLLYGFSD